MIKSMDTEQFNEAYDRLTPKQKEALKPFLAGEPEEAIAKTLDITESMVRRHIANSCRKFGFANQDGEHFRQRQELVELFAKHKRDWVNAEVVKKYLGETPPMVDLESPEGAVALDSRFYVERSPIESDCYKAIEHSGALICIRAPGKMGKTSLLDRILAHAQKQNYRTVRVNLGDAEEALFANLDKFLRWFCAYATLQLELPNQFDNWNEAVIGSKVSCKTYFQVNLLQQINSALVLALEEVDRLFQYPKLAEEFFSMLRSWHEEANNQDIWKQLRLVVVHSTEVYIPLKINQSPFNVGLPVKLTEFTPEQIEDLARRHELNWEVQVGAQGFSPLLALVRGHPYLVRLALYELAHQGVTLEKLLQDASTDAGIYQAHLRRLLRTLREHPELAAAFRQVVTASEALQIDTMQAYRLESLGLIERCGDRVTPRCELYRQYFRERLGDEC
jgi:DNA-binding CsgD family transcriptional regulator